MPYNKVEENDKRDLTTTKKTADPLPQLLYFVLYMTRQRKRGLICQK